MDIKKFILKKLSKKCESRAGEIVLETGFSRAYINRFFQELQDEGKIILVGKANQARYILARKTSVSAAKRGILSAHRILRNKNLSEDIILDEIKRTSGIFLKLPKNIARILDYAFTEMLNNAIEHSRSETIEIFMRREKGNIHFDIIDRGVGIFINIMKKKKLRDELEAIQDLTKGKQTTAPKQHTGEGIFFTSKVADTLTFQSYRKKLIFHNILDDIFIRDIKKVKGTKVAFVIGAKSKRNLAKVFKEYSGKFFEFGKTKVIVRLYKLDTEYISRSQARRVLSGLDKFKVIILDFKGVDTAGQAFADEIFRVWQIHHPSIRIRYENSNKNIDSMVNRAMHIPKNISFSKP